MAKSRSAARSGSSKSSKSYTIDFSKDTSEGGRKRFPEGDYRVKFVKHTTGESKDKGTPFVQVALEVTEGKFKGQTHRERIYITDESLWRPRSFLEAMGVTVPKKKINITWPKYYGKELGITLGDNEYNGRISSQVQDFIDLDTLAGSDVDDDEDEDEEEGEDLDEMDRDELKAYIKENSLDIKVKKTMDEDAIRAAINEAEGDEDDEDEDEDLEDFDADEDL